MLATPHFVLGAAIGSLCPRRPVVAAVLAFGSHFVLDATPHLDAHTLLGGPAGITGPEAAMIAVDTALGLTLLFLATKRHLHPKALLWGAFWAMALDIADHLPPWGEAFSTWPGTAWLSALHHGCQYNTPPQDWLLGTTTQIAVLAIVLLILVPHGTRKGDYAAHRVSNESAKGVSDL
jgi:hypothetical protein